MNSTRHKQTAMEAATWGHYFVINRRNGMITYYAKEDPYDTCPAHVRKLNAYAEHFFSWEQC